MGDGDLGKLLEAEKSAERSVKEARARSERIIAKAEEDVLKNRVTRLKEFEESRQERLKEVKESAMVESGKIRKEGSSLAEDMRKKAKGSMEVAVETVLETILDIFQN